MFFGAYWMNQKQSNELLTHKSAADTVFIAITIYQLVVKHPIISFPQIVNTPQ